MILPAVRVLPWFITLLDQPATVSELPISPTSVSAVPQLDQFRGCLVGQCLGDALGFPVEGSPPEICAPYIEELRAGHCEPWPAVRGNYAFGQYTDDSQLARELMLSYAEVGRFDPADYAARIRSIFAENRMWDAASQQTPRPAG
jgi:ADP-ribosylglycohydrolase